MLVRNAVRFVILCAFVTGALAQTRISIPNAIPRLPEPARVQAKRKQQADIKARGQRVRDAAGAIGLHGIIASGSFKTPGALYGSPGSGRVPGASAADAAHNFLQAFAPVYGLSAGDINSIAVRERPGFVTGNREVIVQQKVAGRNLYGAGLRLHLGPNGEFIAAVGELYGNLRWAGNSKLTSADAIRSEERRV